MAEKVTFDYARLTPVQRRAVRQHLKTAERILREMAGKANTATAALIFDEAADESRRTHDKLRRPRRSDKP